MLRATSSTLTLALALAPLISASVLIMALAGCSASQYEPRASLRSDLGRDFGAGSQAPYGRDGLIQDDSSLGLQIVKPDGTVIDIQNSAQEERKAIQAQPTSFELPFPEATYAWERAKIFFLRYTSSYRTEPLYASSRDGTQGGDPGRSTTGTKGGVSASKGGQKSTASNLSALAGAPRSALSPHDQYLLISNALAGQDPYIFEVRRSPGSIGWTFTVSVRVRPGETASHLATQSKLQAQNLARFIKTGNLDTEMLPKSDSAKSS